MRKETKPLMEKEVRTGNILSQYIAGLITAKAARSVLSVSERHFWRLVKRIKQKGPLGLAHGNRGKPCNRKITGEMEKLVCELHEQRFKCWNDVHFTERLNEKEGIKISRESVRAILRKNGIKPRQKRRPPHYRSRRNPMEQPGMMLQIDGSHHHWLGESGPEFVLIAAIDDATKAIVYAHFEAAETTQAYLRMFHVLAQKGRLPLSVYADCHSIFKTSREPSIEEQLDGTTPKTQLGRALGEICIQYIAAHSPQAKGRVERAFRTMQDRFVSELRYAGVSSIDEANQLLPGLVADYNSRFAFAITDCHPLWLSIPVSFDPDSVFCFKFSRIVKNDNSVSFGGKSLQIPKNPHRFSYAKARVDVHQLLSGEIRIFHQNSLIASFPHPLSRPSLPPQNKVSYANI